MKPKSLARATKRMKLPSIVMGKTLGGADLRGKCQEFIFGHIKC